jgi:hypothetical protein
MADTTFHVTVENWVREKWMADKLGQPFMKRCVRLLSGGAFEFDGVSADGSTVACISTSPHKTSSGRNGMGKFFKLRSDMLYLVMADGVTRRLLVLTERCMYEACLRERKNGRLPLDVEFLLAELPADLREMLARSRERAPLEVRPVVA